MWPHFAFITIHVSLPIFLPQPRNRESFKIKVGKKKIAERGSEGVLGEGRSESVERAKEKKHK